MTRANPKIVIPALLVLALGAAGIWYQAGRRNHQAPGTLAGATLCSLVASGTPSGTHGFQFPHSIDRCWAMRLA